ncbi:protein FAM186A [Candoia aspera]|uniref:protein FAM186A n=1 Tax=Candoia aspera TaxID=51853 RepID=UPI002FD7ED87
MDFQQFLAWQNLPSLTSKTDALESSSSSKSGSVSEYELEHHAVPKVTATKIEARPIPSVEIPPPVKNVLDKVDMAQLERAKKEVAKKLFLILDNVNLAYERYKKDDGIDSNIQREYNNTLSWEEKSRRSHFLDEIDDVLSDNMSKLQDLRMVLESLKDWSGKLKKVQLQERTIPDEEMIDEMEMDLNNSFETIEANVQHLIKLFHPLFTEKMRTRRKSGQRPALLFKAWRDKVADTPQEGEPLTPEQMLEDEPVTFARCHEVNNMIHELGESSLFNKVEIVALKYIAAMVANLIKAFSLLVKQCRNLKLKCDNLTGVEGRKQDPQVAALQRELRMALEKKTALEKQVQDAEERCMVLLITNEMIQKELHDANEKALLAGGVTFSKATTSKSHSKSDAEKDVKSKQDEKPKLHIESKKRLSRKGEGETSDEKWEPRGNGVETSQAKISGKEPSSSGSIRDTGIKQPQSRKIKKDKTIQEEDKLPEKVIARITFDKWKRKKTQEASDEKSPSEDRILTESSQELTDQMVTGKLKAAEDVRPESNLIEKKKLQADTLKSSLTPKGTPTESSEESTVVHLHDTGSDKEASPKAVEDVPPKSSDEKPIKSSSPAVEPSPLAEPPTEGIPGQSIQKDKKVSRRRLSLKGTADTFVMTMKTKKIVKFIESESTQRPTTAPDVKEEPESLDKNLTQTATSEQMEEAPKQLADESAESQEKKETKRWSKSLSLPEQAEKSKEVIHGLSVKLQEIARERDGMIDIQTIKDIFEELDLSYKDTAPGPVKGSHPEDRPVKVSSAEESPLPPDTAEQASTTKEEQGIARVEETARGQDTSAALHEFQEATLACLEEKLEKLKTGPPSSGKLSIKFQPTDPQVQQLFKAIEKKVEECFLIKEKSFISLKRGRLRSSQSMGGLEDKSGKEVTQIPSSTQGTPTQDIPSRGTSMHGTPTQDTPTQDTPTQDTATWDTPSRGTPIRDTPTRDTPSRGTPTWDTPSQGTPTRDTPTRDTPTRDTPSRGTPTQDIPSQDTPTQGIPTQGIPTQGTPTQDTPTRDTPSQGTPTRDTPTRDTPTRDTPSRGTPTQDIPSQDTPTQGIPTQGIPTQGTPTQDTPTQDTPTRDTPSRGTPTRDTPTRDTPSRGTPTRDTPSQGTPTRDTPSQGTPTRDTPTRDTPTQGTPTRDTPSRGTPTRDTPSRGTPTRDKLTRDTPTQGTPTRDTPTRDTPTQGTPTRDTPTRDTPSRGTPTQGTPTQDTPIKDTSTQGTPTQDTPIKDTPTRDTPTRDTPTQGTPTQDTPIKDTSTQGTPTQDTPTQDTPIKDTPTQDIPIKDTPTQGTPTQDTPTQGTPTQDTPIQGTPTQDTAIKDTPTQGTSTQDTPIKDTPTQGTPTQGTPIQDTFTQDTPTWDTPTRKTPTQDTTTQDTPSQGTPTQDTPTRDTPSQGTPTRDTATQETPTRGTDTRDTPSQGTPTRDTATQDTPTWGTATQDTDMRDTPRQGTPTQETPTREISTQGTATRDTATQDTPSQGTPTQDTPTWDTPTQDTDTWDIPTQDTPTQDTPTRETPTQEMPTRETPTRETLTRETPTRETLTRETPTQETPTRDTLTRETLTQEMPTRDTLTREMPTRDTLTREMPTRETPTREMPTRDTPTRETPARDTLTQETPTREMPTRETPSQDAPSQDAPSQETPLQTHLKFEKSLGGPLMLPEMQPEQPITPDVSLRSEPEKCQKTEVEEIREAQEQPQYQKEEFLLQDELLPKLQEKKKVLAKALPPIGEEQSLEHGPDERDQQAKKLKQEDKEQEIKPSSEEQPKTVDKGKESPPKVSSLKLKSFQELNAEKGLWYQQLQEQLLTEKERVQEERIRLQGERQQMEEAKEKLEQWQEFFQKQQEQWKQEQEQHTEQEHLWQLQLKHWQRLQQENEDHRQYWAEQQEEQKEHQCALQEEVRQLQQQYKEYTLLHGEQAKEKWCWSQLKEQHRKQQEIWQMEGMEHERKRRQWEQQLAEHEEQMETLRQAQLEQEEQSKKWQAERQEREQDLECIWEKHWQQQLQNWHKQMRQQHAQERSYREQKGKVLEKQTQPRKELRPPSPTLKIVESSVLDMVVKQYKISSSSKEKTISTTPRLTPSSSIELKEDSSELETTWFPKLLTKTEKFPTCGIAEKRYWINVEAQRKNLKLLREASQKADISLDLYNNTKDTIKQALRSSAERLALLFHKYKSFDDLHEVRRSLILRLDAAREAKDGAKIQNLYKMVDKVDAYQKKVLNNWRVKQNAVEKQHQYCLEKMVDLFAQLHSSTKLHLSSPCPLMVKAGDSTKKGTFHMPHIGSVFLKSRVYKSPLIRVKKPQDFTLSAVVRRKPSSEQIESLWKTDITELSVPLGPKAPVPFLWPEAFGFPDIPRFLELDISSIRRKPLRHIETRIQNIPRWKISGYSFMHL